MSRSIAAFVLLLVLVLVLDSSVFLRSASAEEGQEKKYAPMPWHLADLWWDLGQESPFESYSIDVTISDDVPSSVNLYIAPIGLARLNKIAFYGGIQTQADGHTKTDPKVRKIGPGLLMSMWGERSLDAIRTGPEGFCQSSGHEGDFVSVRRPYSWKKGTYTYSVKKLETETVAGKPATWVGAYVLNHETKEDVFVGALRFPSDNLVLGRSVASFVEVYGQTRPVADIPRVTVTFGNLKVNGAPVKSPRVEAAYPDGVPDYAAALAADGNVVIEVGQPVKDRKERRVKLAGE